MSKFTPGPWGATSRQGDDWDSVVFLQRDPKIEVCQCFHSRNTEECTANARLIAAAPELYQIAKDLCEELRLIRLKDTNAVYDPTVRIRAEIVFAKADGGQQ